MLHVTSNIHMHTHTPAAREIVDDAEDIEGYCIAVRSRRWTGLGCTAADEGHAFARTRRCCSAQWSSGSASHALCARRQHYCADTFECGKFEDAATLCGQQLSSPPQPRHWHERKMVGQRGFTFGRGQISMERVYGVE